jgi:GNAT superfamily N-acetyltransferase
MVVRKRAQARKKKERELVEKGIVEVTIKGKKYQIPYKQGKIELVMVSNHPTEKNKILIWMKQEHVWVRGEEKKEGIKFGDYLVAREAVMEKGKIHYTGTTGHMYSFGRDVGADKRKRIIEVSDFYVDKGLRRAGVGTIFRELTIAESKRREAEEIEFPTGMAHYPEFYEQRGFKKRPGEKGGFVATPGQLDYSKQKGLVNWGKKLEEKGFKIYWAKSSKYKKKKD